MRMLHSAAGPAHQLSVLNHKILELEAVTAADACLLRFRSSCGSPPCTQGGGCRRMNRVRGVRLLLLKTNPKAKDESAPENIIDVIRCVSIVGKRADDRYWRIT